MGDWTMLFDIVAQAFHPLDPPDLDPDASYVDGPYGWLIVVLPITVYGLWWIYQALEDVRCEGLAKEYRKKRMVERYLEKRREEMREEWKAEQAERDEQDADGED